MQTFSQSHSVMRPFATTGSVWWIVDAFSRQNVWYIVFRGVDILFRFSERRLSEICRFDLVVSEKNAVLPPSRFQGFDYVFPANRCCHDMRFYESFEYLQIRYWFTSTWFLVWGHFFLLENLGSFGQIWKIFSRLVVRTLFCCVVSSCYVMHRKCTE